VVSLNNFTGDLTEYKQMSAADQALLRSILFGEDFNALQAIEAQRSAPLTLVEISQPYNFALTEFERGTLIFLQRDAQRPDREAAVHCFAHNVRDALMTIFTLLNFYKDAKSPDPQSTLGILSEQTKNTLCGLREAYPNQLCEFFFLHHNGIKTLCSAPAVIA
jgi:hypothetical protein